MEETKTIHIRKETYKKLRIMSIEKEMKLKELTDKLLNKALELSAQAELFNKEVKENTISGATDKAETIQYNG